MIRQQTVPLGIDIDAVQQPKNGIEINPDAFGIFCQDPVDDVQVLAPLTE